MNADSIPTYAFLQDLAVEISGDLERSKRKFVLAESCTGGLAAALLASIPGMSRFMCGSLVVYSDEAKITWLEVPSEVLSRHGAVSKEASEAMADRALDLTPSAVVSVAITGHLGPDAPANLDGHVWICKGERARTGKIEIHGELFHLDPFSKLSPQGRRLARQMQATQLVLEILRGAIAIGS